MAEKQAGFGSTLGQSADYFGAQEVALHLYGVVFVFLLEKNKPPTCRYYLFQRYRFCAFLVSLIACDCRAELNRDHGEFFFLQQAGGYPGSRWFPRVMLTILTGWKIYFARR